MNHERVRKYHIRNAAAITVAIVPTNIAGRVIHNGVGLLIPGQMHRVAVRESA